MIAPRRNCCLPLSEAARRRAFILTYPQVVRSYPQACPRTSIVPSRHGPVAWRAYAWRPREKPVIVNRGTSKRGNN